LNPELNQEVGVGTSSLELKNFSKSSHSVVFGVVVLGLLALLLLCGSIHWEFNSSSDALKA
jgi:hypothetical protein